ncbi:MULTISPECIES: helix-turn-helix domain-containing protein [unclassified Limnohabitans]|uniref:helix-turn-helix domain-containing protein n=1 Tax=unclassified Limnohabitans TaxID=2626134 RepID=UPI000A48A0B3|nr:MULTISPECIES: helix-turn-helix domain-containing protein [unclassified Limnohabitans]
MTSTTNHIRGEQLRQLRESQGITVSNLAQHVHLSTAQVLQLEYGDVLPGKRSMFYSPAIEEIAAIKVAKALGADPQALWTNTPIVQMNMDTAQSLESPVQESVESRTNHENSVRKSTSVAARPRLPVQKNGKNILIPAIGSAFVLSSCFAIFYTQTDFSIKALANDLLSLATSKTEPQVPPAQLEQAPMSEPSTTSPAPIKAMPEPDQPVTARVQALGFGGCDAQKPAITLSTDQPQKAGLSVYIEALEEVSLCVEDSAGVQHAASLKANENKTFRGTPPWSVHASDPAKIQLFFQGRKFHWPEVKDAFVILKETAGTF